MDLKQLNCEIINLQTLFMKTSADQPIKLDYLDKFFYPGETKLNRESRFKATPGHSPERDARLTLLCYQQYLLLIKYSISIPSSTTIREMVKAGKDINDWYQGLKVTPPAEEEIDFGDGTFGYNYS